MANQHASIWTRNPTLHEYAVEVVAEGRIGVSLARAVSERAGVQITADAIRKHLVKCNGTCGMVAASPLAELTEPADGYAASVVVPPKHQHPKGWEPHVEERGNTATAVSQPMETASADEEMLIRGWNLDPKQWRIVGPVNCRRWQALTPVDGVHDTDNGTKQERARWWIPPSGGDCRCDPPNPKRHYEERWLYYYKANLERIDPVHEAETAALIEEIRTHVPIPFAPLRGDDALVVAIADTQMGKGDQGGSESAVSNFLRSMDAFEGRVSMLRQYGKASGPLYVLGMGDLIEGCGEHYDQQTFRADRNRRDQVKVMRRLVVKALERWAPLFDRVIVACVGGNHGEQRREGKSFTDFADNDDVAIFEQVQEIFAANPAAYGHVSFRIPNDELALTLDVGGEIVGLTHGQVFGKGGGDPAQKAVKWWALQAHGMQPIGDARILFSAHYHHLLVTQTGSKTHFQCPALESGSDWYRNQTGHAAPPGMLTVRIGKNVSESGWADMEVV